MSVHTVGLSSQQKLAIYCLLEALEFGILDVNYHLYYIQYVSVGIPDSTCRCQIPLRPLRKVLALQPYTHRIDLSVQQLAVTSLRTGHLGVLTVHYRRFETVPKQGDEHQSKRA